jgi:tachylectin
MGFQGSFAVGGAIYNVAPDGALRWYQYNGTGQQDPSGATGFAPNSGNQIGRGWSNGFRAFFGTMGVIYAVGDDGSLRWYRYDGTGQQDPTGSTGFAPNSGNQIGRGWSAGFHTYFAVNGAIYAVGNDGSLRWYKYVGSGEQDPTGSTGFAPNSGNQIGRGWADGFRAFVGVKQAIFAIANDGALRWYQYNGTGQQDPTGATGFAPNSGNQIGNGWSAGFRNYFGTRAAIYAVANDGALRWYEYDGAGEQNPSGNTGFAANSGNQIGNGWT